MVKMKIFETCPHCDNYNEYDIKNKALVRGKMIAKCKECKKHIVLCSICRDCSECNSCKHEKIANKKNTKAVSLWHL